MPPDNRCPVCDSENAAGASFCATCGHVLQTSAGGSAAGPAQAQKPPRKPVSVGPTVIAVLCVLLIVAGGFWYYKVKRPGGILPVKPGLVSAAQPWLRLHGSTTIGLALAPHLAEGFLRSKGATGVATITVPGPIIHFQVQGTLPGEPVARVIEIEAKGSGSGFADLAQGAADVAMSSREIKPSEVTALSAFGDFTERASDRVLGLDGVAVIVNNQNPLNEINLDDLARIFSGEISRWSGLRNAGSGDIVVLSRDEKSGTWETFRDLVLEPSHMQLLAGPPERRFEDNAKLAAAVAADPMAIGFVGMTYTENAKILRVGHRNLPFLLPTRLTVLHEEYPLRRRLHLFVPARGVSDPATLKAVHEFSEFALSHDGQSIVDSSGFVSEDTASALEGSKNTALPVGYPPVMRGAQPLYTLYFRPGKADLDPLALDNIDRLTQLMTSPGYRSATIFLAGHADNTGGPQVNLNVSDQRVATVRETLTARGVPVDLAIPLGDKFPIEPNVAGKGNPRNRRVEVWIRKN